MEILYYKAKHDPVFWDASTPKKKAAAYLALFRYLDKWSGYADLDERGRGYSLKVWRALRKARDGARAGDAAAAMRLLDYRNSQGYEYETFYFVYVLDPEKERS